MKSYQRRVVDAELDELLLGLPAVSLEGPKGVGKTATAQRRAGTVYRLDDPGTLEVIHADISRLAVGDEPILVDEWQRYAPSWDVVRRAVDADHRPGRFLLTGSATPSKPTHSGAGRIVRLRVRPLTLVERGVAVPTVSLAELVRGTRPSISGSASMRLDGYVTEILAGGFPAMRDPSQKTRRRALDGYLDRITDTDLPELGVEVRRPATLRRWMTAYAAATATTTSYEKIRDAATAGVGTKPAKTTTIPYREALERLWILEPLDAWSPTNNHLHRLVSAPKHHLADPALAARLVGLDSQALLAGDGPTAIPRDGTFLGALFESLTALSVRVFAQAADARVAHFRTRGGEHEVDFIVERDDQRIVALEVKLSETVTDKDVEHLLWLRERLGDELLDAVVVTTGQYAYRRSDGIAVIPLALLGP
jgi:predicted AAA+ superfamily ATPase